MWKGRETGGLTELCVSLCVREGQEGVEGRTRETEKQADSPLLANSQNETRGSKIPPNPETNLTPPPLHPHESHCSL